MKVHLFDYTGKTSVDPGTYAARVLIFTKSTRLNMTPALMDDLFIMSQDKIMEELKLVANTNPGSWEFIHLSFLITDVTRAFTHQLVRTRTASYAQQTMRTVDVEGWEYETGPSILNNPLIKGAYHNTMENAAQAYKFLIESGAKIEDARGILPTNIHTNICMSINMRNWVNLVRKRGSARVQNEYRKVIEKMIVEVEKVYPWIYLFVKNDELTARKDLQDMIWDNKNLTYEEKIAMTKKLDIIISDL
jgi:flavin-dependent thymidylate synthase